MSHTTPSKPHPLHHPELLEQILIQTHLSLSILPLMLTSFPPLPKPSLHLLNLRTVSKFWYTTITTSPTLQRLTFRNPSIYTPSHGSLSERQNIISSLQDCFLEEMDVYVENRLRRRKRPGDREDTTTTTSNKIPWMHLTTTSQKIPWTYLTQPVVKTVFIDFDLQYRDAVLEVPWEVYKSSFDSEYANNNPEKKIKWKGNRLILYHERGITTNFVVEMVGESLDRLRGYESVDEDFWVFFQIWIRFGMVEGGGDGESGEGGRMECISWFPSKGLLLMG
ncbi:hypothetical protein TWF192_011253 [Orbilia oligospora]|uniref:F-box domain-containing protein n=1 Tax=Orbilia oligospora TaxID=2813651 RepID=A0A6G1LY28_ORBOL|nr:hypothetical protein TWF191_008724 [Orbilia oligospora]KAF3236931.1 hypothetical protein TWF192_011253 [Orbilia oligospora]